MAILDKAGCGGHRLHWRSGLHVCPVQGLCAAMAQAEGLQPRDFCAELPGHSQEGGEEPLLHREHGHQGCWGGAGVADRDHCTATRGGRAHRAHTRVTGPAGGSVTQSRVQPVTTDDRSDPE